MSSESASNTRPMPGPGTGISGGGDQGTEVSPSAPADLGGVPFPLPDVVLEPFVRQALAEDLGRRGDITSAAVIPPSATACFDVTSREPGVVAGLDLARLAFHLFDPAVTFQARAQDGQRVRPGQVLARVQGPVRSLLSAERTALNFMTHLSGIATLTAAAVAQTEGTAARITCTRKTLPGLRVLQKYAVRAGGGCNHRMGLDDAILIKDNHLVHSGSLAQTLRRARQAAGHLIPLEVEVDALGQLEEALDAGADLVLLIAAALSDVELRAFLDLTDALGMTALVETHTEEEVERAVNAGVEVIGINNRDLKTLDVDLDRFGKLASLIPDDRVKVAESGILSLDDARRVRQEGADAILVGEALVRHGDPRAAVEEFASID